MNFSDNKERQRFEPVENGLTAFATYRRRGDIIVIPHVESPLCPYARSWFRRHPDLPISSPRRRYLAACT